MHAIDRDGAQNSSVWLCEVRLHSACKNDSKHMDRIKERYLFSPKLVLACSQFM